MNFVSEVCVFQLSNTFLFYRVKALTAVGSEWNAIHCHLSEVGDPVATGATGVLQVCYYH